MFAIGVAFEIELPCRRHFRLGDGRDISKQRDPRRAERIAAGIRLDDEETRARIRLQILRVHGHCADQKYRPAAVIESIRHYRSEWESGLLAGERGEAANPAHVQQGSCSLGVRRLGCGGLAIRSAWRRTWSSMFPGG